MSLTVGSNVINFDNPVATEQKMEQLLTLLYDGVTAGTATASKALIADSNGNVAGVGIRAASALLGSTKTLTAANALNIWAFDQTAGSVATLPAATGTGVKFLFYVKVLATSNSHIIYCNGANGGGGSDVFTGLILGSRTDSGNAVLGFAAAGTSNTITLNRSTTGSVNLGEFVECYDMATNLWLVRGVLSATGAAFATPFSHT